MNKLKSIKGVEVFSAGVWNGDEYSVGDLDAMVKAFDETCKTFRPALKLGHDERQILLQQDGLPAAGWVGALYRVGQKLVADFIDIPEKIYDLLKRGAYKRVSSEIYWNMKVTDKDYRRVLGAVALLGADMPGVTNLSEIFQCYRQDMGGELKCYDLEQKSFTIGIESNDLPQGAKDMTNEEKAKLEAEIAAEKTRSADLQAKLDAQSKDIASLKQFETDQKAKVAEAEKRAEAAELDAQLTDLVSSKLVTPAMKPFVKALLDGETKKQYSLTVGKDGEKKDFSKAGLLKEILKLHTAKVNTVNVEEGSVDAKVEGEAKGSDKALHAKIEKYAKDNKCDYKQAYKAVMADPSAETEDEAEAEVVVN